MKEKLADLMQHLSDHLEQKICRIEHKETAEALEILEMMMKLLTILMSMGVTYSEEEIASFLDQIGNEIE